MSSENHETPYYSFIKDDIVFETNSNKKIIKKPNRNKKEKYAQEFYEQLKKSRKDKKDGRD